MLDSYYEVLELDRKASSEDIAKAYRRVSLRCHPDRKGGSEEAFQYVARAYEVLSDEKKRASYDRFGLDLGDDENGPEDVASDMASHVNKGLGVSIVRTAITGCVVCGARRRWLRSSTIACCGLGVVYGKLAGKPNAEKVAFRILILPLTAWFAVFAHVLPMFDVIVEAIASGIAEFENPKLKLASLAAAMIMRWLFGVRVFVFIKLLIFQFCLLPINFVFFQLAGHVANEILKHKLDKCGHQIRTVFKAQQDEIFQLKNSSSASPSHPNSNSFSVSKPHHRRTKNNHHS